MKEYYYTGDQSDVLIGESIFQPTTLLEKIMMLETVVNEGSNARDSLFFFSKSRIRI